MKTTAKYQDKSDFYELTQNISTTFLRIVSENNKYFLVTCPYDYKDAFKSKFKATWDSCNKVWEVSKSSFTKADLYDYFYIKNKKINNGTAVKIKITKTKSISTSKQNFEEFCEDVGAFTAKQRAEVKAKYFS